MMHSFSHRVAAIGLVAILFTLANPAIAITGDAADIATLPARRAAFMQSMNRCVGNTSINDCINARLSAIEIYSTDSKRGNNAVLCQDRHYAVIAITYKAKIGNESPNSSYGQYDTAMVDALLGEIIDNCPDMAEQARTARRQLHGM